jgi:cell division septation protein DedD
VPKNEDGEFELILGNRQLFSVFFIVVMLFGVFFVMGYIVGQNSAPLGRTDVASARKAADTKPPIVVDSPGRSPETSAPPAETVSPAVETPPVETAPQRAPEPPKKTEKAPEKPKPEPKRAPEPEVTKAAPPVRGGSDQPVAGEAYLQLVATAKGQADDMVAVLRKNGFRALSYEVPEKPGLFRVLVGPIKDGEMNKYRADLQGKGFQGREAIPKKF